MATQADVKVAELRGQAKALVAMLKLVDDAQAVELLMAFAGKPGKGAPADKAPADEKPKTEKLDPPAGVAFFWTDNDTRVHIRTIGRGKTDEKGNAVNEAYLSAGDAGKIGLKRIPIGQGTRTYKRATSYMLDGTKSQAQVAKALAKVVVRDDVASL